MENVKNFVFAHMYLLAWTFKENISWAVVKIFDLL